MDQVLQSRLQKTLSERPPGLFHFPEVYGRGWSGLYIGDRVKLGNDFLRLGDLASARLFFELAFDYGSSEAAMLVGKTHDPNYLDEIGALGAGGDRTKAVEWYRRAVQAGESRAMTPLKDLEAALGQQ